MNIYDYLMRSVQRQPDKHAIICGGTHITYRELDLRIRRLALALRQLGVGRESTIGLVCRNSAAYLEAVFAGGLLGACVEQFNWRTHPGHLTRLLEESRCSVLFVSGQNARALEAVRACSRPLTVILIEGDDLPGLGYNELINSAPEPLCDLLGRPEGYANLSPDADAFLLYTSGTSGIAKGVVLSLGGIISHTMVSIIETQWLPSEVLLCVLPLFHASSSAAYSTLFAGGTMIIQDGFDADAYLRAIEDRQVTRLGLVPHLLDWLLQSPGLAERRLSSLKHIIYAGAPMSMDILQRASRMFSCRFIQLYGMTEMSPNVAILTAEDHESALAGAFGAGPLPSGRPMMGVSLRVVNENGGLCPPGEVGEVTVQGPSMMSCYYNLPQETKDAMPDGWYHTGDMGWLDETGCLFLAGRKNQMIISGGENIYPNEVEECIRGYGDEILDVAVLGMPDPKWGERVVAFVVKTAGSCLNAGDLQAHCRANIDSYKKPRAVVFMDKLPRSETGKLQRDVLQGMADRGDFEIIP